MWTRRYTRMRQNIFDLRSTLSAAAFDAAWAEGQAMTLDQAVEEALKV